MSVFEMIDSYDTPEPGECPDCGKLTLHSGGSEMYGADRDGRRGIKIYTFGCSECGYEGGCE